VSNHDPSLKRAPRTDSTAKHSSFSRYKILFRFKALLWESIILVLPPLTCKAYLIAILLHDHCAVYALIQSPLLYGIHHTILVMAISCEGQLVLDCCVSLEVEVVVVLLVLVLVLAIVVLLVVVPVPVPVVLVLNT